MRNMQRFNALAHSLADLHCAVNIGIRQNADKFFAAVPRHAIRRPLDRSGERMGDLLQTFVSLLMSVIIIIRLEKVNVNHDNR